MTRAVGGKAARGPDSRLIHTGHYGPAEHAQPFMTIQESRQIDASAERLFAIYADVENWPVWDPDLEAAGINGAFEAGTCGWIRPAGAPRMSTRIHTLVPERSFTAVARLPLCRMEFSHILEPVGVHDRPVTVTHSIRFRGLLAPLYRRLLGRRIRDALPQAMTGLQHYAEQDSSAKARHDQT